MRECLVIEGGHRLQGVVEISGAKNAALPCMAAALLTAEDCFLENVPAIADVDYMAQVLGSLGVRVESCGPGTLRLNAADITSFAPPSHLVASQRGSFLVMGALLARFGQAACSPPGGDVIGQRPIDVHLAGFAAMGADISRQREKFLARAKRLKGARIFMDYPSVLGTENLLLAASMAKGSSVIVNAAAEPEVVCLAEMLNKMGARIWGAGTHTVEVQGVDELGGVRHRLIPDRIEAGTFAVAAAITDGELELRDAPVAQMDSIICKLREVGAGVEVVEGGLRVWGTGQRRAINIQALPYPGLPTDLQAPMAALLTQAQGVSYVHERVFDDRLLYVGELRKMGAEVVTVGSMAIITGPTPLVGARVRALDVRAGAALVLAALVAQGVSEVCDIHHLQRGYAEMERKLGLVNAAIRRQPLVEAS